MSKSKIGVLGSGIVGKVLANGFLKHGFDVMVGTRNPEKLADWKAGAGERGHTGTFSDAAAFADIVVLAVNGNAALSALEMAGAENLEEKTVIDATNPIAEAPPVNGVLRFFTNLDNSLMEDLQRAFPSANFVKAFSCVGNAYMVNPAFEAGKPTMFICGNNTQAKSEVTAILGQFGWETEDMGAMEAARAIEPLCMLWCIPGFIRGQWNHAFKLLKQ